MRSIVTALLCTFALLTCGEAARAQYNKEYFYHMGRTFMMNDDYREAIRTLNTLLRFDEEAYEGYFLRGIAKYNPFLPGYVCTAFKLFQKRKTRPAGKTQVF